MTGATTGNLLVTGGTVVDGTGAPARRADVRIRDGVVAEIGATDERLAAEGERVVDAGGAYVAPGFIDAHTHYDPSMWWDPLVDPMPQHGVTTIVTGNCSLSLSPVRAADRVAASDVFSFIEDIPVDAFATGIPWEWETYADWSRALAAHGTAVHVAALVGHSNLRVYVMGDDAWERAATDDERSQLASVLADSVAAGALGMSTSFIDVDRHGRAVPSRAADDAELRALVQVLAAAPGSAGLLEFLPWIKEPERWRANIEQVARICGPLGVPCTWNQLAQNSRDPERAALVVEQAHRLHAEGARVWAQVSPRPFDLNVSFDGASSNVTVAGTVADQATKEKVLLCCGNVDGVDKVDDQLTVTNPEPPATFHTVVRGDTLSAIAKACYGNATAYMKIFEANKPMLSDPNKIYPGQVLRIPA